MIGWEYKSITRVAEGDPEVGKIVMDKTRLKELNELGAEGWELVSVVSVDREDCLFAITYILKRPLQESY
jgi:hypothetical protein